MAPANSLKAKLTSLLARKLVHRSARLAGNRPVASITFDDFPKNAWTEGGAVLARHGVRGTYYTAGGFCGRGVDGTVFYDAEDLTALAAAGHEIGCHGFGHQPAPALTTEELVTDAARNREFLAPFLKGESPVSYAFPLGRFSPRAKRFYASRFAIPMTCRKRRHAMVARPRCSTGRWSASPRPASTYCRCARRYLWR